MGCKYVIFVMWEAALASLNSTPYITSFPCMRC